MSHYEIDFADERNKSGKIRIEKHSDSSVRFTFWEDAGGISVSEIRVGQKFLNSLIDALQNLQDVKE